MVPNSGSASEWERANEESRRCHEEGAAPHTAYIARGERDVWMTIGRKMKKQTVSTFLFSLAQ